MPALSHEDRKLIAAYARAAEILSKQIRTIKPNQTDRFKRQVRSIVSELEDLTASYLPDNLRLQYINGSTEAVEHLRSLAQFKGDIDETFTQLHREALQQLVTDAKDKFATALVSVTRRGDRIVTNLQKQRIQEQILLSEIQGENAVSKVKDYLEGQQITAVRASNRDWGLEEYSAMLVHTVVAEAHNTGAANRYLQNGVQHARRIERVNCCKFCRPFKDKIIWLGDRRLLPPSHPWCFGAITPAIGPFEEVPLRSPHDPRIPNYARDFLLKKSV